MCHKLIMNCSGEATWPLCGSFSASFLALACVNISSFSWIACTVARSLAWAEITICRGGSKCHEQSERHFDWSKSKCKARSLKDFSANDLLRGTCFGTEQQLHAIFEKRKKENRTEHFQCTLFVHWGQRLLSSLSSSGPWDSRSAGSEKNKYSRMKQHTFLDICSSP